MTDFSRNFAAAARFVAETLGTKYEGYSSKGTIETGLKSFLYRYEYKDEQVVIEAAMYDRALFVEIVATGNPCLTIVPDGRTQRAHGACYTIAPYIAELAQKAVDQLGGPPPESLEEE